MELNLLKGTIFTKKKVLQTSIIAYLKDLMVVHRGIEPLIPLKIKYNYLQTFIILQKG